MKWEEKKDCKTFANAKKNAEKKTLFNEIHILESESIENARKPQPVKERMRMSKRLLYKYVYPTFFWSGRRQIKIDFLAALANNEIAVQITLTWCMCPCIQTLHSEIQKPTWTWTHSTKRPDDHHASSENGRSARLSSRSPILHTIMYVG